MPEATPMVNPVAGTKLLMKRSDTQNKKPAAGDAEYGELFINYHSNSPMLCFKNNADAIVEIRPLTEVELALGELTDVDTSGATSGMVLSYDGAEWVPVSPGSLTVDVDLGYTAAADKGTVTNSAGDDATIPLATGTNAGLTLNNYTTAEKDKLAGYPDDPGDAGSPPTQTWTPEANHGTLILQPGGDNTVIATATAAEAGLMSAGDKDKLDGYPGDPTGLGFVKLDDGNTKQTIVSSGLGLGLAADNLHWDFEYQPGGTRPISYFNPGGAQAHDVVIGQSVNADGNHGIELGSGDGIGDAGNAARITLATPHSGDNDYIFRATCNNPREETIVFSASGKAYFAGEVAMPSHEGIEFQHNSLKLALQSQNLSANYAIRFPPAPADAGKRFLAAVGTNTSGNMDLDWVAGGFDPAVLDDYLPLAGGHMTGGVSSDVGTVPNGTGYELHTHNFWEVGAVTVANPITTDLKDGQSGLFILRDAPLAWGTFYKFKGGTPPAPTSYPAVCPFYVNSTGGETYVGPAIEVQS